MTRQIAQRLNMDRPIDRAEADALYDDAITPREEPTDPPRECPYCRRICSVREWVEQHSCNDCYGGMR